MKGSFVRVGESDELMSDYEIYSYDAFRKRIRDDLRKVENTKLSLLNDKQIEQYIYEVKRNRSNIADAVSDQDILELTGVTSDGIPTLAGHMVFSHYPQANFPKLCITAIVVAGNSMGDIGEEGERFLANQRITGPIADMLDGAVEFVRRNGRTKTIIDDDGKRIDKPEFPAKAVREAVLNALVHRDYSIHTESVPIRIVMYGNRMEIINSGGLYGNISIDSLGKVRPDTRNIILANILELMGVTENRYSGIHTIRKEFQKANLPEPVFKAKRGEFIVIFKNTYITENVALESKDLSARILEFCSIPRTRAELIKFTGYSQYYTMSKLVKPLIVEGKIRLTKPDKPKSHDQKYFTVD